MVVAPTVSVAGAARTTPCEAATQGRVASAEPGSNVAANAVVAVVNQGLLLRLLFDHPMANYAVA